MTKQLGPAAHARLSPSGSKRWMACAGSLTLEAPFPNKHNEYSDDGTAMHEVAAWCLTEHYRATKRVYDWIVVSREGEPVRKVQFTQEMADLVQGYVDYVRFCGIGNELHVEQTLEFSEFVDEEDQFGTTDAGIVDRQRGEIAIIDLKTGHRPVDAEDNSQLMIYALAFLGELYRRAATPEGVLQAAIETSAADEDMV